MYTVLVVDDEPVTRDYLKAVIPQLHPDWQVAAEAGDGREALDALAGTPVDLIVTDIKMPVMDGLEFIRRAAELSPQRKIVILSGYDEFALAREAIRYGVNDYLLKPIVREELAGLLGKIAGELDAKRTEALADMAMRSVSEETKRQVVNHFLQAVVSDNSVAIKTLYPLMYRLKVSLIEAEGAILVLDLDLDRLLASKIAPGEIALFRFIVHQVAGELAEGDEATTVFVDGEQTTAALLAGDNEAEVLARCRSFYERVRDAIGRMTGMSVTGAAGSCESDVQQLGASYRRARRMLKRRLLHGGGALYAYAGGTEREPALQRIDLAVSAIQSALLERSEAGCIAAARQYAEQAAPAGVTDALAYGVYLLQSLQRVMPAAAGERGEAALQALHRFAASREPGDAVAPEEAAALFRRLAQHFGAADAAEPPQAANEHDIVSLAKAYICDHYAEPLSLALVAEQIGVSPGYLSNLFNKSFSESYIKFLTRVRMEQAAKLLQAKPPVKVYDVAEKVGYVSVKHFSYVFKQHYQVPPGEYQERFAKL